jgi:hypothetical protein
MLPYRIVFKIYFIIKGLKSVNGIEQYDMGASNASLASWVLFNEAKVVLTRCRIGHGRLTQLSTGLQVVFGPKIEFFIGPNGLKNRV